MLGTDLGRAKNNFMLHQKIFRVKIVHFGKTYR